MSRVQIQHISFWACLCSNMNGKSRTHCLTKWEDKKNWGLQLATSSLAQNGGAMYFLGILWTKMKSD